MKKALPASPDQKIVSQSLIWRELDKVAIANKKDVQKQRAEYHARRELARIVDDANTAQACQAAVGEKGH